MNRSRKPVFAVRIAALLVLAAASSCEDYPASETPQLTDTCPAGSAVIWVADNYLERVCGCSEAGATVITPPAALNCTVAANTIVIFEYIGVSVPHQIVPTTANAFVPSPLNDPTDEDMNIRSYAVKFSTAGTYGFQDAIDASLNGSIVVTP